MQKTPKPASEKRAEQLRKLIEEAQRQPGLVQVLQLVNQASEAQRTEQEAKAADNYVGGASIGHIPSALAAD